MSSAESEATGQIKHGFVWLGAASVVTRVLDACFTLGVLWLVSREDLGLATLAWSVGVFIEAFNGLGIGTALIQAPEVDEGLLSDAFWYTLGVAVALVGAVWFAAPWLASLWDNAALVPLIRTAASKLFFVGAALVPLTLLNRSMKFERIALANTCATLLSGSTTMGLALAGFGSWSFVIGQVAYGVTIAVAAFSLQPFRPSFSFNAARIWPAAMFGVRAAGAGIVYNLYRNADNFLIGRFLGVAALGVYRVAFELAMTPTVTLLNVVNRSALPAYARLQADHPALGRALGWTTRSLALMLAPITVLLAFASRDLLSLINHGEWSGAANVLPWLAWAAFLRSMTLVFPQVFYAVGRPNLALLEAVASAVVLYLSFFAALRMFGVDFGVLSVGWAWMAGAVLLLVVLFKLTQRVVPLPFASLAQSLSPAVAAIAGLSLLQLVIGWVLPATTPAVWSLAVRVLLMVVAYAAYLRIALHMRLSDLGAKPKLPVPSAGALPAT